MKQNILPLIQRLEACSRAFNEVLSKVIHDAQINIKQYNMLKAIKDTEWWEKTCRKARTEKISVKESEETNHTVVSSDLARYLNLDPTTVCRNLKVLQKQGLVTAKFCSFSQRERYFSVTEKGASICQKAEELLNKHFEAIQITESIEEATKVIEEWAASLSAK